jgi:hypothetical protein
VSWYVDQLAADFQRIDVWPLPFTVDESATKMSAFLDFFLETGLKPDSLAVRALYGLRFALGRVLAWDRHQLSLPIPGCSETSVSARLTASDRQRSHRSGIHPLSLPNAQINVVYVFDDEGLLEISNDTIHALIGLRWQGPSGCKRPEMAIYVKYRGVGSRFYMALITPFRHGMVYPSYMRALSTRWEQRSGGAE